MNLRSVSQDVDTTSDPLSVFAGNVSDIPVKCTQSLHAKSTLDGKIINRASWCLIVLLNKLLFLFCAFPLPMQSRPLEWQPMVNRADSIDHCQALPRQGGDWLLEVDRVTAQMHHEGGQARTL